MNLAANYVKKHGEDNFVGVTADYLETTHALEKVRF